MVWESDNPGGGGGVVLQRRLSAQCLAEGINKWPSGPAFNPLGVQICSLLGFFSGFFTYTYW